MKKLFVLVALIVFLGATSVNAGQICIDVSGCNDVKLIYKDIGSGFFTLNGYEYGCSLNNRIADGTARIVGNTLYISYTIVSGGDRVGTWFLEININTGSGTGTYAYHYDGYHDGTVIASLVSCPAGTEDQGPFEPDLTFNE